MELFIQMGHNMQALALEHLEEFDGGSARESISFFKLLNCSGAAYPGVCGPIIAPVLVNESAPNILGEMRDEKISRNVSRRI